MNTDNLDNEFKSISLFNHTSISPVYSILDLVNKDRKDLLPAYERHILKFIKTHNLHNDIKDYDENHSLDEVRESIQYNLIEHQVLGIYKAVRKIREFIISAAGKGQKISHYGYTDILEFGTNLYTGEFTKDKLHQLINTIKNAYQASNEYTSDSGDPSNQVCCKVSDCVSSTRSYVIYFEVPDNVYDRNEKLSLDPIFQSRFNTIADRKICLAEFEFFRLYV